MPRISLQHVLILVGYAFRFAPEHHLNVSIFWFNSRLNCQKYCSSGRITCCDTTLSSSIHSLTSQSPPLFFVLITWKRNGVFSEVCYLKSTLFRQIALLHSLKNYTRFKIFFTHLGAK